MTAPAGHLVARSSAVSRQTTEIPASFRILETGQEPVQGPRIGRGYVDDVSRQDHGVHAFIDGRLDNPIDRIQPRVEKQFHEMIGNVGDTRQCLIEMQVARLQELQRPLTPSSLTCPTCGTPTATDLAVHEEHGGWTFYSMRDQQWNGIF